MSAQFDHCKKSVSQAPFRAAPSRLLQRRVPRAGSTSAAQPASPAYSRFGHDFSQVLVSGALSDWLPSVQGNISGVPVHYPSPLADQSGARALTSDDGIHLSPGAGSLPRAELDAVLAHESVHAAQQAGGRGSGETRQLESEAHGLAPQILAGRAIDPRFHAGAGTVLTETPAEQAAVEAAKKRIAVLSTYVDEYAAREGRRIRTAKERDPLLKKRTAMDEQTLDPTRGRVEVARMAKLNRAPLDIQISADEVRFVIKFQVRFEDQSMSGRFGELKSSLEEGVRMIWNQKLQGMALGGRKFVVEPQVTLISSTAARDKNYWLITVRPTGDNKKVSYPGCTLDQPPGDVPTSVTDPLCDGGVMSIPPTHVTKPDIFGHELMHLFGLIDRYYLAISQIPGKKDVVEEIPSRPTGGRPDPLGGQKGKVLAEDLAFLFDRLGVYEMEENRGLETLRKLEAQGLTLGTVLGEIHRQQDIIRNGGKKPTLIRPRTDFKDKMIRDAENL